MPKGRDVPLPLVTRFQVAEILGADPTTVAKWEREGLPIANRGAGGRPSRYAIVAVVQWYLARERKRQAGRGGLDPDAEHARLWRAQRRKTEQDIRRRDGELVRIDELISIWSELLATVRAGLLALPVAVAVPVEAAARDGGPRAIEALLRDRISAILRELASWRPPHEKGA